MSLATLLEWWNFVFALPLAVGGVLLVGLALSGLIDLGGEEGDSDHADAEVDHAGELHGDAADADHATDSDGHTVAKTHLTSHDDHADAEKPLWLKALNLFGIGMGLPLSMGVPLLMMLWGAVGLIGNRLLEPLLQIPALFMPLSAGAALFTMALTGRTAGLLIRRVLRDEAPAVVDKYGLIGSTGRAVYEITAEGGVAHVRDRHGNLHRIVCRAAPGEPTIPADTPILVARYDEQTHLYWVERNPLELPDDSTEVHSSAHHQTLGGQA
ncbi:MAG: hypothetical protein WHS44_03865 [Fimbriimonadales bacterium]|nr:MAG: hypothetical protein KatS3mg018_1768 [Fimbriimonadales bacterium]